jgi:putative hydrolase of HD superfamily
MEGADPARASYLALWHDSQETRTGDIPHIGRSYLDAVPNETVTGDQTSDLPSALAAEIRALIDDYEHGSGPEVQCAHDADKLECLMQAVEYRDAGYRNVSSRAKLATKSAQRIADAAVAMSSQDWHTAAQGQRPSKK